MVFCSNSEIENENPENGETGTLEVLGLSLNYKPLNLFQSFKLFSIYFNFEFYFEFELLFITYNFHYYEIHILQRLTE